MVGGSPWPAEGWEWFYRSVKPEVMVGCSCGGTDVAGTFIGGSPLVPVRAGRHACTYLGVNVEAWDDSGRSVFGKPGELVVTTPLPSMPKALWGEGGAKAPARDLLLNVRGSMGPARLGHLLRGRLVQRRRPLGRHAEPRGASGWARPSITPSWRTCPRSTRRLSSTFKTETSRRARFCAFIVLAPGCSLDDDLRQRITGTITSALSPRHVPDELVAVADIPKTLTGKKLEVPVRRILEGASVDTVTSAGTLGRILTRSASSPGWPRRAGRRSPGERGMTGEDSARSGPLTSVRVVEIGSLGPGPFCSMMLADMGADVIRIDRVSGGGPVGPGSDHEAELLNRGRPSVGADLKNPAAVELVLDLRRAGADILIEGFRPGVAERLGIGPQAVLGAESAPGIWPDDWLRPGGPLRPGRWP